MPAFSFSLISVFWLRCNNFSDSAIENYHRTEMVFPCTLSFVSQLYSEECIGFIENGMSQFIIIYVSQINLNIVLFCCKLHLKCELQPENNIFLVFGISS